jgi:hypothetical protein
LTTGSTSDHTEGFWLDENCGAKFLYVCKKKKGAYEPITTLPTPLVDGYCPLDFLGVGQCNAHRPHPDCNTAFLFAFFFQQETNVLVFLASVSMKQWLSEMQWRHVEALGIIMILQVSALKRSKVREFWDRTY